MKLLYIGTQKSNSGYGKAAQGYVKALKHAGYEVIEKDYIQDSREIKSDFDKVIYHCPIEWLPKLYIPNKPFYVFSTWEADPWPEHWIEILNKYKPEKVIVFSKYNKESLQKDYKGKIEVVPHLVEIPKKINKELIKSRILSGALKTNPYIFYSISEWNVRKNYEGLIKAYYHAFQKKENVLLILKTQIDGRNDMQRISAMIEKIKQKINAENIPPVYLITERLSDSEIQSLHTFGDCYVSAHLSEGFGLGIAEAMAHEKPVICTGYSGNMEYCNDKNSRLIDYRLTFVYGQIYYEFWKWQYKPFMRWAEPDLIHLSNELRSAYDSGFDFYGQSAFRDIKENLNINVISNRLKEVIL